MKVDRVTATIRFSQDSGKGAWRSLELGAEAQVAPNENWVEAEEQLYRQLAQRMKALWANGNGKTAVQELSQPETTPVKPHWCAQHKTDFNKFSRGSQTWYSHKTPDNKWCKEKWP